MSDMFAMQRLVVVLLSNNTGDNSTLLRNNTRTVITIETAISVGSALTLQLG
jgi:hypothetical protein